MRRKLKMASPLGDLWLCAGPNGLCGIAFDDEADPPYPDGKGEVLELALDALERYFHGDLRALARIPVQPCGTPFQLQVWRALQQIPPGATVTYGQLAASVGRPAAARAVGAANAHNPLPIVVPCHRAVGKHGKLVGYSGGLWRKEILLEHERALLPLAANSDEERWAYGRSDGGSDSSEG